MDYENTQAESLYEWENKKDELFFVAMKKSIEKGILSTKKEKTLLRLLFMGAFLFNFFFFIINFYLYFKSLHWYNMFFSGMNFIFSVYSSYQFFKARTDCKILVNKWEALSKRNLELYKNSGNQKKVCT